MSIISNAPATGRNQPGGIAGLYNCKTILNEHRPVCTKEYSLTGKYLDGADNPDVWFPIADAAGGSVVYASKFLTITGGVGAITSNRAVIDTVKFPIAGNFEEVTCRLGAVNMGAGGTRRCAIGFQDVFSAFRTTQRATFYNGGTSWFIGWNNNYTDVATLLGRELTTGDIITVRLDRQEGSANIDIVRYYVNGLKIYETTVIPTADMYAGIGVFTDASTTTAPAVAIDYFGFKFVP